MSKFGKLINNRLKPFQSSQTLITYDIVFLITICIDPSGSGILHYDILRIKEELEEQNFIFWAFVNVSSMNLRDRDQITSSVESQDFFL